MKIAIVGSRGIPAKYGGFETFAQELSFRLVSKGIEVEVYCDHADEKFTKLNGVNLKYVSCTKTNNPLKYYYESIRSAEKKNDFIIICGAGGAIFLFSKIFHKNVIYLTNMDGIEYKRKKWSFPKRLFVRFCIWSSVYFSDFVIADSKSIKQFLLRKYLIKDKRILQIEYGAYLIDNVDVSLIKKFNLEIDSYYLIVSRLEPENNVDMIIKGFLLSNSKYPLIIVGNTLDTKYVNDLLKYKSNNVLFVGGIYNKDELNSLRYCCKAYVHGHSVGGTNPSLLEALGAGNYVIAHDNPFNREVTNNNMIYFKNIEECSKCFMEFEKMTESDTDSVKKRAVKRIIDYYNWERITDEYYHFFMSKPSNQRIIII